MARDIAVFGLSPNIWNVLKFLILEIFISVFIRCTYIQLLRSLAQRSFNEGRYISLVSTQFGRLTPYDFMWWSSSDPETNESKHRLPKVILFLLNIVLLALAITAEFGSGSTFSKTRGVKRGFGRLSEELSRNSTIPIDKYIVLKSFVPDTNCVTDSPNGGRVIQAMDEKGHCSSKVTSGESTHVRGCATQPGIIMTKVCDISTVKKAIGAVGASDRNYGDIFLVLNITDFRRLTQAETKVIFSSASNTKPVQRAIVDGVIQQALVIDPGSKPRKVRSEKRNVRCYARYQKAPKSWMYIPMSCYIVEGETETLFASKRRFRGVYGRIVNEYTSSHNTSGKISHGDTVVISPMAGSVVIREGVKHGKALHTGAILYVSELRQTRISLDLLSSTVRKSLHSHISDDVMARLLGFMENIGEYSYTAVTEGTNPVASVNIYFLVPLCLMFLLSVAQGALSLRSRSVKTVPCSFEEAVSRYCVNETSSLHRTEQAIPTFRAVMKHEKPRTNSSADGVVGLFSEDDSIPKQCWKYHRNSEDEGIQRT